MIDVKNSLNKRGFVSETSLLFSGVKIPEGTIVMVSDIKRDFPNVVTPKGVTEFTCVKTGTNKVSDWSLCIAPSGLDIDVTKYYKK